jgi:hypothetical protein
MSSVWRNLAEQLVKKDGYTEARRTTIQLRDDSAPGSACYAFHQAVVREIEQLRRLSAEQLFPNGEELSDTGLSRLLDQELLTGEKS